MTSGETKQPYSSLSTEVTTDIPTSPTKTTTTAAAKTPPGSPVQLEAYDDAAAMTPVWTDNGACLGMNAATYTT
jgi:hypothetical protein